MLSQHSIVWEGLCASVPDGRGQRRVLQDAHGHALSGEPPSADAWVSSESEDDASDSESPLEGGILGILGPSGAGKTTLLRILAGHALPDAGRVLLDGAEYDGATAERIGYVPQEEKLYGCLTASETLMLAARLRAVPAASRGQLVTDTLAALGLTSVAASQVGRLSGGERKRVSVATEMMHSPSLLLLDEPTSGLDANAARALLGSLRALCPRLAVALTIHQPGAKLWAQLSHCCLLAPGAQLYFGATAAAPSYFAKLGLPRPHDASVAEHLLDLAADAEPLGLPLRIAALGPATHKPPAAAARLLHASTARATAARRARAGRGCGRASPAEQFAALFWRAHTQNCRNPAFLRALLGRTLTMAMLVGHLFSNVDLSQRGAQDRAGALFFMLTTQVMSSSASMRTFLAERAIAQHEARSALWAPLPYFLARSAAETLLQATAAAAFGAACYCLVGLAPTAAQFSFFLALVTLATLVAESYVVMVGTLLSDEKAAALVAPLLLALMMASGGFFVSHASTPPLFHALNTVNLFRYAYAGLLRNELAGLSFRCTERELVGPPRPPHAARLALRAARVRWPARVCPISTGEAALERMGVSDLTPAAACGALVLMGLAYRAAGYWALRRRFRSPLA